MSALGQKQTFAVQERMSALPPKADMCGATKDVRYGPKADICRYPSRWLCVGNGFEHRGRGMALRPKISSDLEGIDLQ